MQPGATKAQGDVQVAGQEADTGGRGLQGDGGQGADGAAFLAKETWGQVEVGDAEAGAGGEGQGEDQHVGVEDGRLAAMRAVETARVDEGDQAAATDRGAVPRPVSQATEMIGGEAGRLLQADDVGVRVHEQGDEARHLVGCSTTVEGQQAEGLGRLAVGGGEGSGRGLVG